MWVIMLNLNQHTKKINDIWYPVKSEDFSPNSTVFDYFPRHELVATYQLSYFLCEENLNRKKAYR